MKKILVTQSSMPTLKEYEDEIRDLWDSKWLTNNGIKQRKLEKELCNYLKCDNITLFCNGHMALYSALKLLNLEGEVITTPFTFASTTHAISQCGLKPVFCDIKRSDYTIDESKIEELINNKTCAIVAVHVYGNPCNVERIEKIAKKHNLRVIYDAAHAFGVEYNRKAIASFGDISMFSFHATKVFNTIEGGAVVYGNPDYSKKLNMIKNFGIVDSEHVEYIGMNCKMNEFQAAMGLCNLKHIDEEISKRKSVFERYIANLSDVSGIKVPEISKKTKHNYSYFPIVIEDSYGLTRDELYDLLEKNDIYSRKYFYPLVSDYGCYKDEYNSNDTPIAKDIANRVLTLPMYADLSLDDVDKICDLIRR